MEKKSIIAGIIAALFGAVITMSTSQSIEINAPADVVWAILVDVNNWAGDNPSVQKAKLLKGDGESVGSVLKLQPVVGKRKPRVKLTITVSEKNKKLEYSGKLPALETVMGFTLEERDGKTILTNYESATGRLVRFIKQGDMDEEHRLWVEAVKKRAEGK